MAKSKKTTDALTERLRWLRQQLDVVASSLENAAREVRSWPVETIERDGHQFKARIILSEQVDRAYGDLSLEDGRLRYEVAIVEQMLSPSKGRPKGKRNEKAKPPDPTIAAALKDLENASRPKPDVRVLAVRHCKDRTKEGRRRWIYRLKKAITKANRSQS